MSTIDELCPPYVGAARLKLQLASTEPPRSFESVAISVSRDAAADTDGEALRVGFCLPLELTIKAPSSFVRHVFRRVIPSEVSFLPKEGGEHLVLLREVGHNRWWGRLLVVVAGEQVDP